jgi:hypothetical protein
MLAEGFVTKPFLWVVTGAIGALAYFAKAYSFPFFILNTLVCVYFVANKDKALWLKICAASIITMMALSSPWIVALHHKYGIWTTSTAGTLNMSWYLVGHPHWKEGINLLLPPAYPDSPYYWEDPWFANGDTPHFWSSWHLFGLQFLRIGLNMWKLLRSCLELSVFFPVIGVLALLSLRSKKWQAVFSGNIKIVVYSFLLFPLGYVLINFESRYLWYMLPLGLVMGGIVLQQMELQFKKLWMVLLAGSLLVFPVWGLMKMYDVGITNNGNEHWLRRFEISGETFTSDAQQGPQTQEVARFAYFNHCHYCNMTNPKASDQEILAEMRRYHVRYYISLNGRKLLDEHGNALKFIENENAMLFTVEP